MAQLSKSHQDLATIDVLRDIDYPSCAYYGTAFAYVYMRTRVPQIKQHEGVFYIRRGLRVVSSMRLGNATASKCGTGKRQVPRFFCCVRLVYENSRLSDNVNIN